MPPFSKTLEEEGAAIKSFKLVVNGEFQEKKISELLLAPAHVERGPDESPIYGTRNLKDNISDLKAQVAANQRGTTLLQELIAEYGLNVVLAYMNHVQDHAEFAVRDMLREISRKHQLEETGTVVSEDCMDDGSAIRLALTINRSEGSAIFNFTGTDPETYGNCNAPKAVTYSAIIYCLRCLVDKDIPLNQGCLNPISVILPAGTILSPSPDAAVVGGNVLTSQRVT